MAGCGKGVVDQVGKGALQIKNGRALPHHPRNHSTAVRFFLSAKGQVLGIGIGCMKVKGNSPDIGQLHSRETYIPDGIPIDPIDCHVEANIVTGGILDIG